MAVNQALADAAIGSGEAFDLLDRIVYRGGSEQDITDALVRRFGGAPRMNQDTADYILRRYTLYRNAGLRIQNRNDNSTAGQQFLPNVPGCTGDFEYVVVVPFTDTINDVDFTKAFTIASDVLLGKQDILYQAALLAAEYAARDDTLPGGHGDEHNRQQSGMGRVTAAARCTP